MWVGMVMAGGKLASLPQILYYYRIHNKQITANRYETTSHLLKEIQGEMKDFLNNKRINSKPRSLRLSKQIHIT
jgi:hypothetical protein